MELKLLIAGNGGRGGGPELPVAYSVIYFSLSFIVLKDLELSRLALRNILFQIVNSVNSVHFYVISLIIKNGSCPYN